MTETRFTRFARIASGLFVLSLLTPAAAQATPAESGTMFAEVKQVEQTAVAATDQKPAAAPDLTRTPKAVTRDDDGIVTTVTSDPSEYSSITIDDDVHAGIVITDPAEVEDAVVTPVGKTVFKMKDSDDAYVFQILDGGSISASAVTMSPESDRAFTYSLTDEITPVVQNTGAVALYDGDSLVGIVEHPEARDARGNDVPSSYSGVEGDLVQTVQPAADTVYPLVTTAAIGVFQTKGDYVHVTGGQASGHGWWLKGTTKAVKAKVTVQLQYKPKKNSSWNNRGKADVRTIKPGTSKRANARVTCRSSGKKQWRSWVDVDLIGYLDTPDKLYTSARTLKCTL